MPADLDLHIRTAGAADIPAAVDILTGAIATTSIARWMLPSRDARARHLQSRLTATVTQRVAAGSIRVADEHSQVSGAIVWTTCTPHDDAPHHDPSAVLLDAAGDAQRSRLLHAQLAQRHPGRAHHHLLAVGVRPSRRQKGIGTALLADWHDQLGPEHDATFLLAPSTLLGLARHAGYRTLGHPIMPMIAAPALYALWRKPPAGSDTHLAGALTAAAVNGPPD